MNAYKRHDLVWINASGRARLCAEACAEHAERAEAIRQIFGARGGGRAIPGIVRRDEHAAASLPIGFVHPRLFQDRRLRVGSFVKFEEIDQAITPDQLLQMEFAPRNHCMKAAAEVQRLAKMAALSIGILGSAGLEIATGLSYTNEASDLDLLIGGGGYDAVAKICRRIEVIGNRHHLKIDMEVELPNGYGVKAKELFMQTQTILGKSLTDVKLLERNQVITLLNDRRNFSWKSNLAYLEK